MVAQLIELKLWNSFQMLMRAQQDYAQTSLHGYRYEYGVS